MGSGAGARSGSGLARARTAFLLADRDDHGLGRVARVEEDLRREDALLDVLRRVVLLVDLDREDVVGRAGAERAAPPEAEQERADRVELDLVPQTVVVRLLHDVA